MIGGYWLFLGGYYLHDRWLLVVFMVFPASTFFICLHLYLF
ncbi:hypothetical protein HanRHA438_Chr04g0174761 [Helianthus annuus]|nr:hypothetical protein HanRHA438_Chr04g0174761 [Helianthus annuus]